MAEQRGNPMRRRLILYALLAILGAVVYRLPVVPSFSPQMLTAESWFSRAIRDEIPPRPAANLPHANPCSPDFDQGLVDAYNDSLPRALAHMLSQAVAQKLSPDMLKEAFRSGTNGTAPSLLVQGSDYFLAAFQLFRLVCAPGSRTASNYNLYVLNREGSYWGVDPVYNWDGSRFPFGGIQWAGNGWLAIISQEYCVTCFAVWKIAPTQAGWSREKVLDIEGEWYTAPELTLSESDQRFVLNLQPRYLYSHLPCTFVPEIQTKLYLSWQKVRRVYERIDATYQQVNEEIVATHVLISAVDENGYSTYRELEDWEDYCQD
jgi:hypothetical protein